MNHNPRDSQVTAENRDAKHTRGNIFVDSGCFAEPEPPVIRAGVSGLAFAAAQRICGARILPKLDTQRGMARFFGLKAKAGDILAHELKASSQPIFFTRRLAPERFRCQEKDLDNYWNAGRILPSPGSFLGLLASLFAGFTVSH